MKPDCVWVYKGTDKRELEYSIKSLKNIEHGRTIVVGDLPELEVEHFKPPINRWSMLSPHHDVISKLLHVVNSDVSDEFYLWNDDFFITRPTVIPVAHRGPLHEHVNNRKINDSYTKTLRKTLDYLKGIGIAEPLSYELHIPMALNKQKLKELYDTIIPMITHASPMLTRSLYGNIYNIGGEFMDDVKNVDNFQDHTFLSTNNKTFQQDIGEYIRSVL